MHFVNWWVCFQSTIEHMELCYTVSDSWSIKISTITFTSPPTWSFSQQMQVTEPGAVFMQSRCFTTRPLGWEGKALKIIWMHRLPLNIAMSSKMAEIMTYKWWSYNVQMKSPENSHKENLSERAYCRHCDGQEDQTTFPPNKIKRKRCIYINGTWFWFHYFTEAREEIKEKKEPIFCY